MQPPIEGEGLPLCSSNYDPGSQVPQQEVRPPLAHDRTRDELETHSIKWNVARIVRLSSGNFALLTHYRAGALDIIKVGTIEEILPYIPTAEQCCTEFVPPSNRGREASIKKSTSDLMADIGLT